MSYSNTPKSFKEFHPFFFTNQETSSSKQSIDYSVYNLKTRPISVFLSPSLPCHGQAVCCVMVRMSAVSWSGCCRVGQQMILSMSLSSSALTGWNDSYNQIIVIRVLPLCNRAPLSLWGDGCNCGVIETLFLSYGTHWYRCMVYPAMPYLATFPEQRCGTSSVPAQAVCTCSRPVAYMQSGFFVEINTGWYSQKKNQLWRVSVCACSPYRSIVPRRQEKRELAKSIVTGQCSVKRSMMRGLNAWVWLCCPLAGCWWGV